MYGTVREVADSYRVSKDAVYLWIRKGIIPSNCVIRIRGTIRVNFEAFRRVADLRFKIGELSKLRIDASPVSNEGSHTTHRDANLYRHRLVGESDEEP